MKICWDDLFTIYGKIKDVPYHQPDIITLDIIPIDSGILHFYLLPYPVGGYKKKLSGTRFPSRSDEMTTRLHSYVKSPEGNYTIDFGFAGSIINQTKISMCEIRF